MQNVIVTIEEQVMDNGTTRTITKNVKTTQAAIANFQRIYGTDYKGAVMLDDNGNPIEGEAKSISSPKERAFAAMKERAKQMKIKGYQNMKEDTLLNAIQEAAKNLSN